jgi:WW domain-binding protein 2
VSQGGIPPDIVRVEIKLTFKDGGHNEFRARFEELKERLEHIRRIERETGQTVNIPDEPLPAYEARNETNNQSESGLAPVPAPPAVGRSSSSASQNPRPNEPPPDYDEAQAQAVSMRLEDHIREEAERQ